MDKVTLRGPNLGRVFNSRSGCMPRMNLLHSLSKWPNLDLKSWPKQLLSSLPLSGIYTGEKTLHVVAIASGGDLKRWKNFY
jgi:hypothetical protein